jgi:hypothetical protein
LARSTIHVRRHYYKYSVGTILRDKEGKIKDKPVEEVQKDIYW